MSSHFLLSAASRGFGLPQVMVMSDADIFALCCRAKWPQTDGVPVCPICGKPGKGPYSRLRFKCTACNHLFTLTSGTVLHQRKIQFGTLLLAVVIWASTVKDGSSPQLSRILNVNYRTAFILSHKIRYSLLVEGRGRMVGGPGEEVEIDGCYIGGHVRPANFKINRRDRRLRKNRSPKRRVVVIARERKPGGRTIFTVVKNEGDAIEFLSRHIRPGTIVFADEAASWNDLSATHEVLRINHQAAYSDGVACTNWAESMFSRLRKAERGQHHRISGRHLHRYAAEVTFREDFRRLSMLEMVMLILHLLLTCDRDPDFTGRHWKRRR